MLLSRLTIGEAVDPLIFEALVQNGALGLFAAYLAWANAKNEKKLDALNESFMKRVEDIQRAGFDHLQKEEEKFLLREDGVRSNYDSVVKKLDGERRLVVSQLGIAATKLDNLIASNAQLAQQLADLSSRVDRFERDMTEIRAALNHPNIVQNQ